MPSAGGGLEPAAEVTPLLANPVRGTPLEDVNGGLVVPRVHGPRPVRGEHTVRLPRVPGKFREEVRRPDSGRHLG